MLAEGTEAPTFVLPGVVDGAPRDVDIDDYIGDGILVLAFVPATFSPACAEDSSDLTELDLFTMQRDVDIFAISPDSVFANRQFVDAYSLSIPMLSDTHGEAMDAFDVRYEASDQLLAERAVFVVDQRGTIQYAWSTTDLEERPDVDAVRQAVSDIGGDSTALGRYRVGHAHYMEGRRAFTSAMGSYEERDWLIAQTDFERAMEEFTESADQFQSAVRFAESGPLEAGFERAQEKATSLWQAAEWLADSANMYASGNGEEADNYRQDAETPLETARDIGEPPDPDDFTLDADAATEATESGDDSADLDAPTDPADDEDTSEPGAEASGEPKTDEDIDAAVQDVQVEAEPDTDAGGGSAETDAEAASDPETSEPTATDDTTTDVDGTLDPDDATTESDTVDSDEEGDGDDEDEDIELDLKDPTE